MELITKAIGIELTSEERKVIKDLANNCESICKSYNYCINCPFEIFCNHNEAPHEVLTFFLDELTKE